MSHGSPSTQVGAVDGLGEDARHRGLARAARPDEEEPVGQPVEPDGVPQRLDDGRLADDLAEGLGTPAPVQRLVRAWSGRARAHVASGAACSRSHWPARCEGIAVHPPSTGDVRVPIEAIDSDQAGPRHPASSA